MPGLFSTYLTSEMDILASSPTLNVRYEAHSKSYGDYSKTEMRRLVAHFKNLSGWKKWIPLLLAYTGARRAEIAKLKRSDVRLDDDSQRYYIMIDDTKTEAGTRQVPLSLHLLDLGFLDYVEGFSAGDSLFPDLTNFNQITHFSTIFVRFLRSLISMIMALAASCTAFATHLLQKREKLTSLRQFRRWSDMSIVGKGKPSDTPTSLL